MKHVLTLFDLTATEITEVLSKAAELKQGYLKGIREPLFPGCVVALLFEKPSLRTRVSFESAITHLGGNSMYLGADVGWGKREAPQDFARVLGSYVDAIVCRAYQHSRVAELAEFSKATVINGLTDSYHPCQALTDLFTLQEAHGDLRGQRLAYIGDANNVAQSLAICCARLGVEFALAAPSGYQMDASFVQEIRDAEPDASIILTSDPREAVSNAQCVYTDVWTSMGQESEAEERLAAFQGFQVDRSLMQQAPDEAVFMHCLPAHRGIEVSADVLDGQQSVIYQQAENRMHVQKGLLAFLLGQQRASA